MTTKSILWIKWKTKTVVDMASAAEVKEFSARCQQLTNHPVWPSVAVLGWSNALRTSMQQEKVCRYTQKKQCPYKKYFGKCTKGSLFSMLQHKYQYILLKTFYRSKLNTIVSSYIFYEALVKFSYKIPNISYFIPVNYGLTKSKK